MLSSYIVKNMFLINLQKVSAVARYLLQSYK